MQIDYSDGEQVEAHIRTLIKNAPDVSSGAHIGTDEYNEWAIEYHLCPERTNLLRPFNFSGLNVLEVGAGMGAVSRLLAERAKHLTIIEGTESRFGALNARLRDLDNWTGQVGNLIDVDLEKKFDVVVVVGVLEYAELFIPSDETTNQNPFERFVAKCKSFLKPEGVLILAIENRIGLKYWAGITEDHLGTQFDGICGYADTPTAKTFSQKELAALFRNVGFSCFKWYYPFPDYKIPSLIITSELVQRAPNAAATLAATKHARDYVSPKIKRLFPDTLALKGITDAGLLEAFSNSFLVLSCQQEDSPVLQTLTERQQNGECAWYYSNRRVLPVETIFKLDDSELLVSKTPLKANAETPSTFSKGNLTISWQQSQNMPFIEGTQFLEAWYRKGYFGDINSPKTLLQKFIGWSLQHWDSQSPRHQMPGEAIDAVATNAVVLEEGFALFDLEWQSQASIPASWFVLRNLICLSPHRSVLISQQNTTLHDWYVELCKDFGINADLENDLKHESIFQGLTYGIAPEEILPRLNDELQLPFSREGYPRKETPTANKSLMYRLARRGLQLARKFRQ